MKNQLFGDYFIATFSISFHFMQKQFPLSRSKYVLQEIIGSGTFAEIYIAKCIDNNEQVAIKIINLDLCPIDIDQLRKEVSFWATSDHKNILKYYGSFVVDSSLWFVTELMDVGSCYDIIKFAYNDGFHDEVFIATILKNVVNFLVYFHKNHQIHRQIRCSNILVSRSGDVKIADFGLAAGLLSDTSSSGHKTFVGFLCYMAPEVVKDGSVLLESSDIWSLGITAIELANGHTPFCGLTPIDQMHAILENPPPQLPEKFSHPFRDFVKHCLNHDPSKRSTAAILMNHPFLKKAKNNDYVAEFLNHLPPLHQRYSVVYGNRRSSIDRGLSDIHPIMFTFEDEESKGQSTSNEKADNTNDSFMKIGRFTVTVKSPIPHKIPKGNIKNKNKSEENSHINQIYTPNSIDDLYSKLKILSSKTAILENSTANLFDEISELSNIIEEVKKTKSKNSVFTKS